MPNDKKAAATTPTVNPLNALQLTVLQALLAPLTNINQAFAAIEANPTQATVAEQIAVIEGQAVTLQLEVPALLPTVEDEVIAAGAQQAQTGLGDLISSINAKIASLNGTSSGSGQTA